MENSDMIVEIVGEYVIIKKEDKKSVLDNEDLLHLLQQFSENENKVNRLVKEYSELKATIGVK
ncbi:MAG: hypothetical protein J6Y78_11130 [Paludibacteraceae bacterium]|nr:hypothetical protein [Paludibacteraceae bacterium]